MDRAIGLLPTEMRTILIERYIQDSTHAEIAERLGLSEGAVRVRVHRGKLALQRILTENFTEDAVAYGFKAQDPAGWESSRVWCPLCGSRRLAVRVDRARGTATFRCDDCCRELDDTITDTEDFRAVEGLKAYKAILSRQLALAGTWQERLRGGPVPCEDCAHEVGIQVVEQCETKLWPSRHGWAARCRGCNRVSFVAAHGLALTLPDTQRFWREHPRMRSLPEREVEVDGVQCLVVPLISAAGSARLDVVATRTAFHLIGVHA